MCGISGVVAPNGGQALLRQSVERMVSVLHHRGPDGVGTFVDQSESCALGHNRLSVLDLSDAGRQPMVGASADKVIVYNGEVYNFRELRTELRSTRAFKSETDTEVVLAAFERWGVDSFPRLNGMFAFAIFDQSRGKLFLVRDRLGIKPLYLSQQPESLIFGSEIKALLASGLIAPDADFSRIHEYLYFGNTLGEGTLYKGIRQLPPGHWAEIDVATGRCSEPCRYWSAVDVSNLGNSKVPEAFAVERTTYLLEQAVRRQLVSDVPVGVFLSGGVDSSAIVALASRCDSIPLRTYSVGFDYIDSADELSRARRVAERFGTDHHELHASAASVQGDIELLAAAHDQPFADPANLPLFQLCKAIGGDIKVALQGDGGDELFAGYRRYAYLRHFRIAKPLAKLFDATLHSFMGFYGKRLFGAHRFFHALAQSSEHVRMALLLSVEGPLNPPTSILNMELRHIVESSYPFARYRDVTATIQDCDELKKMLLVDLQVLLPDIFLQKVDRSTMAASVEVRVPFLDFELVDFVCSLPSDVNVRFNSRKRLLRMALMGIVPPETLNGKKRGFGVPIAHWLKGHLRSYAEERIYLACGQGGWLDRGAIDRLFNEHCSGRRDHSQILWKALQLAIWIDRGMRATPRFQADPR